MAPRDQNRITRRRFTASAGCAAVGMMAAMTQQAPGANQPATTTQASTAPSTAPTAEDRARVASLEQSLGRALSPEMRQLVAEQIHQNEQAWARGRRFAVPDGTDPAFVFAPSIHVVAESNPNPTTREADDER
jgi:hypothetical protein